MESIWEFFTQWLTLLKGPSPPEAFALIDGSRPGQPCFDVQSFAEFLKEFSGDPNEKYSFEDILLEGEDFDLYREDSNAHPRQDGSYFALLYMPLQQMSPLSHQLVLAFHFMPLADNRFRVLLDATDDPLIL
jgi:hypothetical protein